MNRLIYIFFGLVWITLAPACQKGDNYDGPNASFFGALTDAETGEPFQSEQPNGFRLKWTELSHGNNVQPDFFWGMPDGKFNWNFAFGYAGANYEIVPIEGAFAEPAPQTFKLDAGGRAEINFKVTPILRVAATHQLAGSVLTVQYVVTRPANSGNGATELSRVLVSGKTKYLGLANQGGFEESLSSPQRALTEEDLGKTITEKITLIPGKKYFMRVAAKAANPSGRVNYSPVVEINIP